MPDPGPPGLRLPGDVKPTLYHLDLTIDPAAERAGGKIDIEAQIVMPTWVVWLNATEIDIKAATLDGKPAHVIPGGGDYVGLALDRELPVGPLRIAASTRRCRAGQVQGRRKGPARALASAVPGQ